MFHVQGRFSELNSSLSSVLVYLLYSIIPNARWDCVSTDVPVVCRVLFVVFSLKVSM